MAVMTPAFWSFGFHAPRPLRECIARGEWTMFGHVEAWGWITPDVVMFFDPSARSSSVLFASDDDALDLVAAKYALCRSVIRFRSDGAALSLPFHPTMNCAAQCAHLIGRRAYTPGGLRRILLANGGEETRHAGASSPGRPHAEAGARA